MKHVLLITVGLIGLLGFSAEVCAQEAPKNSILIETLFDLSRPEKEDVIYFRNKDVLRGRALNETVTIATQYGMLTVPLRRCAGLSFEGARANTEAVVTVNFNRITGIITDRVINFQIKSSGTKIPIRKEKIRFLLLQRTANEADFIEKSPKADLFLMANGDLLSGEAVERKVTIRTDYARVPVSFAEMKDVKMHGGDNVTAVISKTNGDTMRGTLDTDEMTLDLEIGIQVAAIYKDKFARIFVDQARRQLPVQFGVQQPIAGESEGVGPFPPPLGGDKFLTLDLGNGVKLQLILIRVGKFIMGSPDTEKERMSNEGPQRNITITKSFYMGVSEISQTQWEAVMATQPWKDKGYTTTGGDKAANNISWDEAVQFCQKLSKKLGRTVRLPTEAEWEYACRAGSKTRFSYGDDANYKELRTYAWFKNNSSKRIHEVARKKSNVWGLYDMYGNVSEWCNDWYADGYSPLAGTIDPKGPKSGTYRVLRGGDFGDPPVYCRSARRRRSSPGTRSGYIGFRVVVSAGVD